MIENKAYQKWFDRGNIIEIRDYIWSETSGLVQGEIIKIGTMQIFRNQTVYFIQRIDNETFVIPTSDVKSYTKSNDWYEEITNFTI